MMQTMNEHAATATITLSKPSSLILLAAEKAFGPESGNSPLMMRLICIEAKQLPEITPKIAGKFLFIIYLRTTRYYQVSVYPKFIT
jgi:hypothetical protein